MRLFILVSSLLLLAAASDESRSGKVESRIVNGFRVNDRKKFSYQISLRKSGHHICGGILYKSNYVITAAHCVHDEKNPSVFEVVAGDLNLHRPNANTQKSKVNKIFVHPQYSNVVDNDVAVLRLAENFTTNPYVKGIPIYNATKLQDPKGCVISGWGADHYNGATILDLMYAYVDVLPPKDCRNRLGQQFVQTKMICAALGTNDACNGDSGGPLVCNGKLYGVVSWGYGCGNAAFAGVYTNASFYNEWIQRTASSQMMLLADAVIILTFVILQRMMQELIL